MICFNCYTEFHPTLSKPVQILVCVIGVEILHVFIMTLILVVCRRDNNESERTIKGGKRKNQ
jgi:hypothetical protein